MTFFPNEQKILASVDAQNKKAVDAGNKPNIGIRREVERNFHIGKILLEIRAKHPSDIPAYTVEVSNKAKELYEHNKEDVEKLHGFYRSLDKEPDEKKKAQIQENIDKLFGAKWDSLVETRAVLVMAEALGVSPISNVYIDKSDKNLKTQMDRVKAIANDKTKEKQVGEIDLACRHLCSAILEPLYRRYLSSQIIKKDDKILKIKQVGLNDYEILENKDGIFNYTDPSGRKISFKKGDKIVVGPIDEDGIPFIKKFFDGDATVLKNIQIISK